MNIKIIEAFNDSEQDNKYIEVDTELTVSNKRGNLLIEKGKAEEIKIKKNKSYSFSDDLSKGDI